MFVRTIRYLYAKQYLPHEKRLGKAFLDILAEKFVHLFWSLQSSADKDFFLECASLPNSYSNSKPK